MDKIKRFIDIAVPSNACNFHCHYCYIGQHQFELKQKPECISRSPEEVRTALSRIRLGGVCLINFCAYGETLLPPNILAIIKAVVEEGHYVMIVTNGSMSVRFKEIAEWDKTIKDRVFIKFSLHFLELKAKGMLEIFAKNVKLMKQSGVSFMVEIVPNDELVPHKNEVMEYCMSNFGALCHVSVARDEHSQEFEMLTNYSEEDYDRIWGEFNSLFFKFKRSTFNVKRTEFCYAGDWSISIDLQSGVYKKCTYEDALGNIYDKIDEPLHFEAVGCNCRMSHCYNSHAYLTAGVIPELNTPSLAEVRNRICDDGSEWLTPTMKEFMSSKLSEENEEYSKKEKRKYRESLYLRCKKTLSHYKLYQVLRNIKNRF